MSTNELLTLAAEQMEFLRHNLPVTQVNIKDHAAFCEGTISGSPFFCSVTTGSRSTPSRLHVGVECVNSTPERDRLQVAASVISPVFIATADEPSSILARAFRVTSRIRTDDASFDRLVQIRTAKPRETEEFLQNLKRRHGIRQLLEMGYGRVVHQGDSIIALKDSLETGLLSTERLLLSSLETLLGLAQPIHPLDSSELQLANAPLR